MNSEEVLGSRGWQEGERFFNPHLPASRRRIWHVLLWQLGFYDEVVPIFPVPDGFAYPNQRIEADREAPTVTWINHTTFLIELDVVRILTDPVWSDRCSPINFIGPRRLHAAPIAIEALGRIDYVLISHDHYDHLDRATVCHLYRRHPEITWMVPLGVGDRLRRWGLGRIVELDWWEGFWLGDLQITAVPAQHFSGRTLFDRNRTLWCGWVIQTIAKSLYFAGDTGYNSVDFKRIGEQFGAFDLSLVPIGAYLPRAFMSTVHACPNDAVAIHLDCRSRLSVGSHWYTFCLSSEAQIQPPYDLYLAMLERGLPPETFRVLDPGQSINF